MIKGSDPLYIEWLTEYYESDKDILIKRIHARKMDWPDAEDVVQEAFYAAIKFRNTFYGDKEGLKKFFNGVLNNTYRNMRRAMYDGDFSFTDDPLEAIEGDYILIDSRKSDTVKRLINKVKNEKHRSILKMVIVDGHTFKAAAAVHGLSKDSIHTVVKRFRSMMRNLRRRDEQLCVRP